MTDVYLLIVEWLTMKAKETARTYLSICREWSQHLGCEWGERCSDVWAKVGRGEVLGYLRFLRTKPGQKSRYDKSHTQQANATIRKKITVLRTIYELLHEEGVIQRNPWATRLITKPNPDRRMKRKTEALTLKEVRELLRLPDLRKRSGVRDMALLSLCLGAGLRISEALRLTTHDIVIDDSSGTWALRIRESKAGPDQEQPLPTWAQEALTVLVAQRRSDSDNGQLLFMRYNAKQQAYKPLLYRTAARILNRYFLSAGLLNKSSHSLRKSAINKLASEGENLINVRDFARHKSVTSTEKYLDEVKKTAEAKKVYY